MRMFSCHGHTAFRSINKTAGGISDTSPIRIVFLSLRSYRESRPRNRVVSVL